MPMGKKIFFVIAFLMLSFLLIRPVLAADIDIDYSAELSKVCKASHCTIPIPTLVDPNEKVIKIDQDFYLTGLTWNNTKIDIYVDDEYQGSATVVNDDDSDTANFYYLIENSSLLEGVHEWKVIAWAETLRKRSYVSMENSFTIENYFLAPILKGISKDIDGNNWIIGSAENNSIVSIYVDNVYQGQVRTDGNFNYNIGQLSPGLHTFYTLARQADTGRISKRSNILSEQVSGTQIIEEEFVEDFEPEEVIPEPEEPVVPEEPEEVIPEPETEDQISSISEEKEEENNIVIQDEESQDNVNVTETEDHDVEVGVISHEESQDQLVVDSQKSELNEEEKEEDTVTEELQAATPDGELTEMLMGELDVVEKQERNRKVGLWLLIILIVIVMVSTSLSEKKTKFKAEDSKKKDDDSNSHQGDLFNRE
jgi:hypothetical protein